MKQILIFIGSLLTLIFIGCGSGGGYVSSDSANTIAAGETVSNLPAGTTITTYSGTCSPNIVVNTDGTWNVTNASTDDGVCQYN